MGLIINQPIDKSIGDVLTHLEVPFDEKNLEKQPVLYGGPVQPEHGFVVHAPLGNWRSSATITDNVAVTTSKDVLLALGTPKGPDKFLMTLGYASWSPGQLEDEIAQNGWLVSPASQKILFDTPIADRLKAAGQLVGINELCHLTGETGHA